MLDVQFPDDRWHSCKWVSISIFHLVVFEVVNISFESNIRFANAVKLASATTTSGAYSTSKICFIAIQILLAWRSDQKLKSSGSLSSVSESSEWRVSLLPGPVMEEGAEEPLLHLFSSDDVDRQEIGIKDGSESRHNGTMRMRLQRTFERSRFPGRSTIQRIIQFSFNNCERRVSPSPRDVPRIWIDPSRLMTLYLPSWW